ncbi:MAG: RHS repeat-associated core domain-containing protein, partial [Saprospiraceae bacterium]
DNLYQYNACLPARQGKELNNDHGIGLYDYGARWYDPSIGRFPSVDPIISKFPYLTPYNYASNDPVGKIDLWGLQGVQFTEVQKGKTVRAVEADVYIGVGEKGFTNKEAASISKTLNTAYDTKIDGQKVDFRFNVKTFEANKKSDFDAKANQINKSSKIETADGKASITGVVIGKGELKDRNQGGTIENKVTIRNDVYDLKHTVTHEVGHFMLLGSANQPQSKLQHENAGGIFYPGSREPDGTVVTPTQNVSKDNVIKFLENVPYKKQ